MLLRFSSGQRRSDSPTLKAAWIFTTPKLCSSMKHCCALLYSRGHNSASSGCNTRNKASGCSMLGATAKIDVRVLLADLKVCSRERCLERGKQIHAEASECGHCSNIYVANALISMYARCGSMLSARQVFDSLEQPDVVSWNALILGYAENGEGYTALQLFAKMRVEPTSVTILAALKACSLLVKEECRKRGKIIQLLAVEKRSDSDICVQNTLISMYAICDSMVDALQVFVLIKHPSVVSWNSLIMGYAENGHGLKALDVFSEMRSRGPLPSSITFLAALKACDSLKAEAKECRQLCRELHAQAVAIGCIADIKVQNTLIDMYSRCGSMDDARQVFDNMKETNEVSWTVLILGYANNGQGFTSLQLFRKMKTARDSVTFVAALKACTSLTSAESRERVKGLHNLAIDIGIDSNAYVESTMIDMYSKCGSMADARLIFDTMKHSDVVSWNALIMGYADNGQGITALNLFSRMRNAGPAPNCVTLSAALKACGLVGALDFGRTIHSELARANEDLDVVLVTGLVDFYAKCGSLMEAKRVFDLHPRTRSTITWNALLAGFSSAGDHTTVFRLLQEMQDKGFHPDSVTFVSVLTCCSHAGLVAKGKECFDAMPLIYGVVPTLEHFNCMVDVFGRSNKLDDAMTLVIQMPYHPNDVTWKSIMMSCSKWKNSKLWRLVSHAVLDFNLKDKVKN